MNGNPQEGGSQLHDGEFDGSGVEFETSPQRQQGGRSQEEPPWLPREEGEEKRIKWSRRTGAECARMTECHCFTPTRTEWGRMTGSDLGPRGHPTVRVGQNDRLGYQETRRQGTEWTRMVDCVPMKGSKTKKRR